MEESLKVTYIIFLPVTGKKGKWTESRESEEKRNVIHDNFYQGKGKGRGKKGRGGRKKERYSP